MPPELSPWPSTSLDRFEATIVGSKRSTPPQLHELFAGALGSTRRSHPNGEQPESAAQRTQNTTSRSDTGGSGNASAYPGGGG